jgi:DNA-binding MarR family transcriptional regulator
MTKRIPVLDYRTLAELRHQIRRFLRFSEGAARGVGLEPRQHQLMLALKGLPEGVRPNIGELAERLQIAHHSAVELVNRLSAGGHIRRAGHGRDRREVLLALTPKGERILLELSLQHKEELRTQGPALVAALKRVMEGREGPRGGMAKSMRRGARTSAKNGGTRDQQ